MTDVTPLLERAKRAVASGEGHLRAAAEDIAAAQEQGATQRQIAEAVGKSAAWVNRLLKWRQSGYQDGTAFGPQAKASRQRAQRVQSPERKRPATTSEQAQATAARARAEQAKAEAQRLRPTHRRQKPRPPRPKPKPGGQSERESKRHDFFRGVFGAGTAKKKIHSRPRELLIKALGMLGSDHEGERANAALVVEKQRRKLGMTWDELIISADEAGMRAA